MYIFDGGNHEKVPDYVYVNNYVVSFATTIL